MSTLLLSLTVIILALCNLMNASRARRNWKKANEYFDLLMKEKDDHLKTISTYREGFEKYASYLNRVVTVEAEKKAVEGETLKPSPDFLEMLLQASALIEKIGTTACEYPGVISAADKWTREFNQRLDLPQSNHPTLTP